MFRGRKKKETRFGLNKKGFSLVEILIAIGILVMITVPLAMNMISSSQINSKAKQTAASSDLTTAIIEMMQTVDLSDVLTDVNGYGADEYGTPLKYTLTGTALKNYKIGSTAEMLINEDGNYVPVTKQEDVIHDYLVTSSINTREAGDVTKAYFTGQDDDNYTFLLSEVETDEMSVDVLATIVPKQTFSIVNIVSMNQSEVIHMSQPQDERQTVAEQFKKANERFAALNGGEEKTVEWFYNNMERITTVTIEKDPNTDATSIVVEAVYSINVDCLRPGDKTIVCPQGSFSTNSTAEFARGVYLYYYPLLDGDMGVVRDHFVINNKNELAAPVYFIALSEDAAVDFSTTTNYHPTLNVNERSSLIYPDMARTTVCSNIKNELWDKSLYPADGRELIVKTIGNASEQQTMYEVKIQVYRHRDASYTEDGVFDPRDKDLLIETTGTFIDTSEKLDISSDESTGVAPTPGICTAGTVSNLVYQEGVEQRGVFGNGVIWSGDTKAIEAGTYYAKATPMEGFTWGDGSSGTRTFTWEIARQGGASAYGLNFTYDGMQHTGVGGEHVTWKGVTVAKDADVYTAYATPEANYTWEDGTTTTRSIKWRIAPKVVTIEWKTGEGLDLWRYDGSTHYGSFNVYGIVSGDACSYAVKNMSIRDVGVKVAEITGLSNQNYVLPSVNTTHELRVYSDAAAYVNLKNNGSLVYNGTSQSIVADYHGVSFSGIMSAKNADTYTLKATPITGYSWPTGTTETRSYSWKISPVVASLQWGARTWTYDGAYHGTTCIVTNAYSGDNVEIMLSNNSIKNAGSQTVTAIDISNSNYVLPTSNLTCVITIVKARLANYAVYNFDYDGDWHVGIVGSYIKTDGTCSTSEVKYNADGTIGYYDVAIEPIPNYAWADGSSGVKYAQWQIRPKKDALVEWSDMSYAGGDSVQGVFGRNTTHTGDISGTEIGVYYAYVTPLPNHAWYDTGKGDTKTITWEIVPSAFLKPGFVSNELEYNGENQSPQLTMTSLFGGYYLDGDLSATNVGTYTAKAYLEEEGSTWADGSTDPITLVWKIVPRTVTITYDANEWTYDGQYHTGTATIGNIIDGDTCEFFYGNNTYKHAGEYAFQITGLSNTNYRLPAADTMGTIKINKRTVGISWNTLTWEYDGTQKTATATATNIVNNDTVTFTYSNNTRTNAGSQTVTISGINCISDGESRANYQLPTNHSNTMSISRAPLATASIINGRVYIGAEQSGITSKYVTWTADSVLKATDAGTYVAYGSPDSNHYWSDDFVSTYGCGNTDEIAFTWRIKQAEVGISWGTVTWTYDGNVKTVTATPTGTYSRDSVSFVLDGHQRTNAGTQTVTVTAITGTGHRNYKLPSSTTNTLTINKAAAHIVAPVGASGLSYDGTTKNLIATAGSTNWGTVKYKLGDGDWQDSANITVTNAGDYVIYYYSTGDDNHLASEVASITVRVSGIKEASCWSSGNKTYSGSYQQTNGGTNVTRVSGSAGGTNVGTYGSYYVPATNYEWSDGGFEQRYRGAQITPLCTASCASQNLVYTSASRNGVLTQNNVTVSGTTSAVNVGTYTFTATPIANYAWQSGTTETRSYTWEITRAKTATASCSGSYTYTGSTFTANYSGSYVTWTGISGSTAKTYYAYATPDSNHAWADGTTASKKFEWTILPATATVTYKQNVYFSPPGAAYCNASGSGCSISGTTSSGIAGTYSFTATCYANYIHDDGSTSKTYYWTAWDLSGNTT